MGDFDRAIEFVLDAEGGYVNDPNDPGGETNMGISKRSHPGEDIAGMTRARAEQIYRKEYWNAIDGDNLPTPLDIVMMDSAVNEGPKTAKQHLANALEDQGRTEIGSANPLWLATDIIFLRLERYTTLPGWVHYSKGWTTRMISLYDEIRSE